MLDLVDRARRKSKITRCEYRVCAICFDSRGNLLGIAKNYQRFDRSCGNIHAEMAALHKWGPSIARIILVRFGLGGDLRPIHPCPRCAKVLDKMDIKVSLAYDEQE